ncbi:MAG TPA: ABC transporter ATP-binding protein [Ktedonobacterales bacterium]
MSVRWRRPPARPFSDGAGNGSSAPATSPESVVDAAAAQAPVLEARSLTKHFPLRALRLGGAAAAVHAVENVSLALYPGRVTALVGESGSGKTTVARLLAHIYRPTSGEIHLRGKPTTAYQGRAFRAYCGDVQLIFQDPFSSLNPVHTIAYHLRRPLRIHGRVHSRAEETAEITTLLQRVNLTPQAQTMVKFPHELSGGQRQRIAIARALAARPKVLLADEPISMLDVSIRLDILNLLRRLKDEDDLALLYITHDIAGARYFADETMVMYAGQMVEGGPSDEVTERPAHPYTQLLVSAAPDPERFGPGALRDHRRQMPARGEIPSLITPPSGCRFHPRCPHAMAICARQVPPRAELGGGHFAHCWLHTPSDGREPLANAPAQTLG